MTELVFGLSAKEKSAYVLDQIKLSLKQNRRVVLIVPEQQALVWDRRCARALPARAMMQIEIVSFTRLADSVSGGLAGWQSIILRTQRKPLSCGMLCYPFVTAYVFTNGRNGRIGMSHCYCVR